MRENCKPIPQKSTFPEKWTWVKAFRTWATKSSLFNVPVMRKRKIGTLRNGQNAHPIIFLKIPHQLHHNEANWIVCGVLNWCCLQFFFVPLHTRFKCTAVSFIGELTSYYVGERSWTDPTITTLDLIILYTNKPKIKYTIIWRNSSWNGLIFLEYLYL